MKFLRLGAITPAAICALLFATFPNRSLTADTDHAVLQEDRAFVQAAAKGDASTLARLLDKNFTWCDSNGQIFDAAEVLRSVPKGVLGDEPRADLTERTYGQVAAVTVHGKFHILRLWVQRPSGWFLLVYHEVKQMDQPPSSSGTGVKNCENPCKSVPLQPANEAEQAIIASWQALETAVTAHESSGWAPHIAEEFIQVSSNSDHPITKSGRMATLDKQKQLGVDSAPSPLVSAKMFDFGDAVVMTCLHQPRTGKAVHVTRLWIKREGRWVMVISYQTAIQVGAPRAN